MRVVLIACGLLCYTVCAVEEKSGHRETCEKRCDNVYALNAKRDVDDWFACNRGCRLFNLIEFNFQRKTDANLIRDECCKACNEAYSEGKLNNSCSYGCEHQVPFRRRLEVLHSPLESKLWSPFSHFKLDTFFNEQLDEHSSPFQLFDNILSKLRSTSFWSRSKPTFTFLTQGSDGQVKIIHYKTETFQTQTAVNAPEVVVNSYSIVENGDADESKTDANRLLDSKSEVTHLWPKHEFDRKKSWFSCFTYQTAGVPRWLLVMVLSLAIVALAWICCATTVTAPTQHIKRHFGFGNEVPFIILRDNDNTIAAQKDDVYWKIFTNTADTKKESLNHFESPPSYEDANQQNAVEANSVVNKS